MESHRGEQRNSNARDSDTFVAPGASLSLPKGGGAVRGLGEKFAAQPVTGTGSMSVPIASSPGRAGTSPDLALSYDSGNGNGPFGFGWNLSLPAITRKTATGLPRYQDEADSDVFMLSGSEDLMPVFRLDPDGAWIAAHAGYQRDAAGWVRDGEGQHVVHEDDIDGYRVRRYRPRIEGSFERIERWTRLDSKSDVHWRSISGGNVLTVYGSDARSRIVDPHRPERIFSWLICESRDDRGNGILYRYKPDDGRGVDTARAHQRNRGAADDPARSTNRYIKSIYYGNCVPLLDANGARPRTLDSAQLEAQIAAGLWMFEVVFDYGEHDALVPRPADAGEWQYRGDAFSSFRSAFELRTTRLCRRVLMFHHFADEAGVGRDCLVHATELRYSDEADPANERNAQYTFLRAVVHAGFQRNAAGYDRSELPPLEFTYSEPVIQDALEEVAPGELENLPAGIDGLAYRWIDLHGEGIPGVLTEQGNAWFYKRNLSPLPLRESGGGTSLKARFAPLELVAHKPNVALASAAEFLDLAGDGTTDVVLLDAPVPGVYRHDEEEGWQPFRAFISRLNRDLTDPNLRFVDLDGDGREDVLITEENVFVWHASLGDSGFGAATRVAQSRDEELGPRVVFSDPEQSIFLADLNGDGLADIVRVRNGEVCYWPNQGFGRFGSRVTMDNSPWFDAVDRFDPRRLRFADVDGSGTADLIYLHGDGVRVYFNQSGNGWSRPQILRIYPAVDDLASILVLDLLGNGTACLVWSSGLPHESARPMRYVNLMGARKPHLLVGCINNLGAETRVDYVPSTRFYLEDKRAGTPWVTKLPFPVQVVERVATIDHISRSRFVTRYAYHHGYYDGEEREFRGFGRVDSVDTESYEDYVAGVQRIDGHQELAPELHQPEVTRRTWYLTGAPKLVQPYVHEYYQRAHLLPEARVPPGLEPRELRECLRALKGLPLREETYGLDGSPQQDHPYTVSEHTYEIRRVQPAGFAWQGVFTVLSRENIAVEYERDPTDPRIQHQFTLEVDDRGNGRKSCSVVYGRRIADATLPEEVRREQQRLYIAYAEAAYTPDVTPPVAEGVFRQRVPHESRSFEVTGIAPVGERFEFGEISAAIAATTAIGYEEDADGVTAQRRLLAHSRTLFLDNALNPLPPGQLASLGLKHESYKLAFTPAMLAGPYAGLVSIAELAAGGYVRLPGDANWWVPSGTSVYPADPRAHFFMPSGARDPFGIETAVTTDKYQLLVEKVEIRQAAWDVETAVNDYRVLGPVLATDANGNRTAVEHDALGMVVKTVAMGKAGSNDGDTLADPTTRMEYQPFNWMNNRKPNYVHTLARERHGAANPRWQETYTYSNGSGNVVMVKGQAHPGKALRVKPDGTVELVDADPRWVGNGRTVVNNKGSAVKQYEPYFSTTHEYEDEKSLREIGATPLLFYDAAGRNIRTLFPNGTLSRVEFTPWLQKVFDTNDTVLESRWYTERGSPDPGGAEPLNDPERRAAWLAAKHAGTPGVVHFDSLGRHCYAVSDYGAGKTAATRSTRDFTGRRWRTFDQAQREVASGFVGITGVPIFIDSAEKGRRWTLQNVFGALIRTWDEHGREFSARYDGLNRPLGTFVRQGAAAPRLLNYIVYGDRLVNARQLNLLGGVYAVFDSAGMMRTTQVDFKGNPVSAERMLAKSYLVEPDWNLLLAQPDVAAVEAAAAPLLDTAEVFSTSSELDALNRPLRVLLPDGTTLAPTYNVANFLSSLKARIRGQGPLIEFLKGQEYDAKGQRQFAHYGNDVLTRFFYDPKTFRLTRLLSARLADDPQTDALQDLNYTYDPASNVTQMRDDAQQTHYFGNAVVRPESRYQYDALYQLVRATGRESAGLGNDDILGEADTAVAPTLPHINNLAAVRNYTEEYDYDLLGNIQSLRHRYSTQAGVGAGWTRHYRYAFDETPGDRTNRLARTSMPGDPDAGPYSGTYDHDVYGNMTRLPHLATLEWNVLDQLRRVELGGGGTAYYVYAGGGQRMRKVIERNGDLLLEWIYLGAVMIFRRRRRSTGALRMERWTVHIGDNAGHIAQIDTKTRDEDNVDPANALDDPLVRYQYSNHLGSAILETNSDGDPISYEEYHPFGTSAYRSSKPGFDLSLKRFRFSGKERDDETGLYYFGARYLAAWLGRWTSSDPAGFVDGPNLYRYCHNNPVGVRDATGHKGSRPAETFQYSITRDNFTGREKPTLEDFKEVVGPGFDKRINASNSKIFYEPKFEQNLEMRTITQVPGGTWHLYAEIKPPPPPPPKPPPPPPPPTQPPPSAPPATSAPAIPPAPAIQALPTPPTPYQTTPIPKVDLPQAPPGTNFKAAESSARAQYRDNAAASGNPMKFGEQVQHPAKWRDGARTNLHPDITNDQDFLHPIQSRTSQMGGKTHNVDGRTYRTDHTYADRGLYPKEAAKLQRRWGGVATERVTHVWAGQRVRQALTGSRGPSFFRQYIVAPMVRGFAGHLALASTRTFIPFVAEAELGLLGAGVTLYGMGYTSAAVAVYGAAAYVPVVGGSLVAGAYFGNVGESVARDLGASEQTARDVGMLTAMATGAAVGALIGSVIPGVGTAAGALIGVAAGGIGYALSKYL